MDFRYLGSSGMQISEITYGNWLTHGSQVENDVATQCVRAALDAGITTFDTADVYANGRAEDRVQERHHVAHRLRRRAAGEHPAREPFHVLRGDRGDFSLAQRG